MVVLPVQVEAGCGYWPKPNGLLTRLFVTSGA